VIRVYDEAGNVIETHKQVRRRRASHLGHDRRITYAPRSIGMIDPPLSRFFFYA